MTKEKAMEILYDLQTKYVEDGNDSEIIAAIDVAFEAMSGYLPQNIYYRTADRLPTAEDAGEVLVSFNGITWMTECAGNAKSYNFWAPCPKVEVRG